MANVKVAVFDFVQDRGDRAFDCMASAWIRFQEEHRQDKPVSPMQIILIPDRTEIKSGFYDVCRQVGRLQGFSVEIPSRIQSTEEKTAFVRSKISVMTDVQFIPSAEWSEQIHVEVKKWIEDHPEPKDQPMIADYC